MHARAIEWRPASGDGWASLANDQIRAAQFSRIDAPSDEPELLSPAMRRHLSDGVSFIVPPADLILLVFGCVQADDAAEMRPWLDGLFPDILDPGPLTQRHPLDEMASILCDYADDRWLMLGSERQAWNLGRTRMRLPVFSGGILSLVPLTVSILGNALIACWHDRDVDAVEHTSRVDGEVREQRYSGLAGAAVDELASRYVASCLKAYARATTECNRWLDGWEDAYIAAVAARTASSREAFDELSAMRRNVLRLQNALDELEQGRTRSLADAWWSTEELARVATATVIEAMEQATTSVSRLRAGVSDAFVMASIAATMEQSRVAYETQARFGRLQQAVTWLTAFLLAPGLVAAVFGANVALPGREGVQRTIVMVVLMAVAALATFALLSRIVDRDRA